MDFMGSQSETTFTFTMVLSSMDDLGQDPLIHEDIAKQWFLFSTSPEFNSWNTSMNKNILSNLYIDLNMLHTNKDSHWKASTREIVSWYS